MTTFTIALPDEQVQILRQQAERAGTLPEELLRQSVQQWLRSAPDANDRPDFAEAAAHVLRKNAELYRRLA